MGLKEFYYGLEDKYYALLDKINNTIPIHKLTDQIDKVMPSMIFFSVLSLVIIGLIVWLIIASFSTSQITFQFYVDNSLVNGDFTANITAKGFNKDLIVSDGILQVNLSKGEYATVKITEPYSFTKTYEINSNIIKVNLPQLDVAALAGNNKNKDITIYLLEKSGTMIKDQATVKASCDGFEKELTIIDGFQKVPVPENCTYLDLLTTIPGYVTKKQTCDTALCKVILDEEGTTSATTIMDNFPKNKVVVYVMDNKKVSLEGFDVKITNLESVTDIVDQGKTTEFGSYTFDEITVGKYKLYVSDPTGTLVTYSQDLEVTAGNPVVVNVTMAVPPLGYFKIKVKTEDNNGFAQAVLFVRDINNNVIDTRDVNTGEEYKVGVYTKGNYFFQVTPYMEYDMNYSSLEEQREYDQQSGDKLVELELQKLSYFNNTKINLKVVKLKDGVEKPLPEMKIRVEHNDGEFADLDYTFATQQKTDSNGFVSLPPIPTGSYKIVAYNSWYDNYKTPEIVTLMDNPAAIKLPEVDAKIVVEVGKATLKVSVVDEDKKPLTNVDINVYMDSSYYGSMSIIGGETSKELTVEAFHDIYFKVSCAGYLDYYSQEIMLKKGDAFDQEVTLYSKEKYLAGNPEIKFVGMYKDSQTTEGLPVIDNKIDFYYVFDIFVPEFSSENKKISAVTLYGAAGRKDLSVFESDLILRDVLGFGTEQFEQLYAEPKIDSSFANQDDTGVTNAKWFSETFNGNSYVTRVAVKLRSTDIPKVGEKLYFYYALKYNLADGTTKNVPSGYVPFFKNATEIINFLGKRASCEGSNNSKEDVCVDTYINGLSASSFLGGSSNEINLTPGVDNNIIVNLMKGEKAPALNTNKFSIFNSNLNIFSGNFDDLKEFSIDLTNKFLTLNKITSSQLLINPPFESTPLFLKEYPISNYAINNSLEFKSKISLLEPNSSRLYFYFKSTVEDEDSAAVTKHVDLQTVAAEPLELYEENGIDYLTDNHLLTPNIANTIPVVIKSGVDKIAGVSIKVYISEGVGFNLQNQQYNTGVSDLDGKITINIRSLPKDTKVTIVAEKTGYLSANVALDVTNLLFDTTDVADLYITAPKEPSSVSRNLNIENKTNLDFTIKQAEFYGPVDLEYLFSLLYDVNKMQNYFNDPKILSGDAKNLEFNVVYDEATVSGLPSVTPINGVSAMLHLFAPNSSDELVKEVNFNITIDFDNSPLEPDCFNAYLTNEANGELSENISAVFLNGKDPVSYLVIENYCYNGAGDYSFEKIDLNAEMQSAPGNIPGGFTVNIDGYTDVSSTEAYKLFGIEGSKSASLIAPKERSNSPYIYKITYNKLDGYNFGNDTTIKFTLTPYYKKNIGENGLANLSSANVNVTVSEKDISECLTFGLSADSDDPENYLSADPSIIRFGYEKEGGTTKPRANTLDVVGIDDIELPKYESSYKKDTLPLTIINNCGIDLKIKLCDKFLVPDSNYCKVNGMYLSWDDIFNRDLDLKPGEENSIDFDIMRPTYFSGALVIPLSVKDDVSQEYNYIKNVKIAVQSSKGDKYFVVNPFITNNSGDIKVFINELYPDFTGWENNFNFNIVNSDPSGAAKRYQILDTVTASSDGYLDAEYSAIGQNETKGFYRNFDDSEISKLTDSQTIIKDPNWILIAGNIDQHKGGKTSNDDESTTGQYWIWSGSLPDNSNEFKLNYNFDTLGGTHGTVAGEAKEPDFFDFYGLINKMGPNISAPYFVNLATAGVEGDSGGKRTVYSYTFCPPGFEPVDLEFHRDKSGQTDSTGNNLYTDEQNGVQSFIYGGQVDLDTDIGKNDEGATTYAQLLICRKTGLELSLASFVQGYNFNSTTNLEISGSFNGADAETIKLYHTTDSSKDYFFESNLGSCPYGGNTGSEFKPTINYTWGDLVDKEFCVVKDENYAGTTACDLLQFAKVIEKQDQKEFQVKLMYDNYSESALKATENAAFFTNFDNIRILDYSGNPIGVLNPGIYNVNIVQKDNDLDVYLAYVSSYSPNQIFYYMPVDNTGSGLISGVGTAVDKQLSYAAGSEGVFSLVGDEDKSALKQYEVKNYSFKELNTTEIGSVFSGYFNDNLIYYNPMKIFKLTETIPKDENITLNCSDVPEYGSELCEILLHGWTVEKTEGEYIYAENDGIRFEIVENGEIKELKIINLTNVEKTIERIVYSNAVNLSALNVAKEITGLSIDNLESLYNQISKGNVCYKSVEGGSEYYYNPVKLLDMIK